MTDIKHPMFPYCECDLIERPIAKYRITHPSKTNKNDKTFLLDIIDIPKQLENMVFVYSGSDMPELTSYELCLERVEMLEKRLRVIQHLVSWSEHDPFRDGDRSLREEEFEDVAKAILEEFGL